MEQLFLAVPSLTEEQKDDIYGFLIDYVIAVRPKGCECNRCEPGLGYNDDLYDTFLVCLNCVSYCDMCGKVPMTIGYTRCYKCCLRRTV